MGNSKIEWTNKTWNPLAGCTKVSPGCANCYAETMAKRLKAMGQAKYADTVNDNGRWTGRITLGDDALLNQPLRWQKPSMIFVNSMSDLFHNDVPFAFMEAVFEVMAKAKWHTFQVLTKRPARAADFYQWTIDNHLRLADLWPLPNVWLGTSVENQKTADERIPHLVTFPATIHFLSCEPLLEAVDLDLQRVDWVIAGGESGPNARPMHPDWARSIRDQCIAADVPFLFKQWGEYSPYYEAVNEDKKVIEWREVPNGMVRRVGKKAAGRLLDGRTWDEFPTP